MKRYVSDCYKAWEGREKMEKEIEERERWCEVEEDRDEEENWRREKRREDGGGRAKHLDIEYYRKDLCRRLIADTGGIIDIRPLCLRHGCSRCEFLQST